MMKLLDYLIKFYSTDRVQRVSYDLLEKTYTLRKDPQRGAEERRLIKLRNKYRFILYKRTSRAEIKIIYFIDDSAKTVHVTDFFPTEKDDKKIAKKN